MSASLRCWLKSDLLALVRNVHAISGPAACTQSDMCGEDISEGAGKEGIDVVENIDDVTGKPSIMLTANKTGRKMKKQKNGKGTKNQKGKRTNRNEK